mmetsp:Transcript_10280/g.31423  ORF Transcript_10280/g.31423 Transcript_10280/m.31423 type:complete len:392 (-) Transcript_10280:263-1438(-)
MKKPPVLSSCGKILLDLSSGMASEASSGKQLLGTFFILSALALLAPGVDSSIPSSSAKLEIQPCLSLTFQVFMPGLRLSCGSIEETSMSSKDPSVLLKISATTASFSMGLREHVEYTSLPPTCRSSQAFITILSWILCRPSPMPTFHLLHKSGAFLSVPSPLQGTSHRILSKSITSVLSSCLMTGNFWPSWFVTIKQGLAILLVWWVSKLHLLESESFATTYPPGMTSPPAPAWSISKSWKVLDPGAAQVSSTVLVGLTSRKNGGIMLAVSCLVMFPASVSRFRNSWNSLRTPSFLIWLRLYWICHPFSSGYHASGLRGSKSSSLPSMTTLFFVASSPSSAAFSSLPAISFFSLSRMESANLPLPLILKVAGSCFFRMAKNSPHSSSWRIF